MEAFKLCVCLLFCALCCPTVLCTPLDDYVMKADSHYDYHVLSDRTVHVPNGYTIYVLNMTSQKWLSELKVDQSLWSHDLYITVPDKLTIMDAGFIYVTGGHNGGVPDDPTSNKDVLMSSMFALGTGRLEDPQNKTRSEDGIIAYTWKHYLDDPTQPEYLLRLPMTKAVVRAMDTISDFVKKINPKANVQKYMIAGGSKRGWTTWTTAAVDKRVFAMAPIVLDCLNFVKNLHHHYRSLGGWTFAFEDYYDEGITKHIDDALTQKMFDIVDPYAYKERLTMPKLIVTASGDEFFLPDDSHYYYDNIPGPKFLKVTPNSEHSQTGHYVDDLFAMRAFFLAVYYDYKLPNMTWTRSETATTGSITLVTDVTPLTVKCFRAKTLGKTRRDFRLVRIDPATGQPGPQAIPWLPFDVQNMGQGKYKAEFGKEDGVWIGFYIQATYPGPKDTILEFTTEVHIIPDEFPFADCKGEGCYGILV
uniref:Autocrine proliferation repressor protein A-like n=1 Tax=Saccoglossus kowalevskii TaxID=10224 RepID=A0ABM0GJ21_SACKO|nr:PREDICTED: autocrine proliferation repressor protein A-like [Saccoglossus kowalevskii]